MNTPAANRQPGPFFSRKNLLVVSPDQEDHRRLKDILGEYEWTLQQAHNCREAVSVLCFDRPPILLCDCHFSDGTWMDILGQTAVLPDPPRFIVMSRDADEHLREEVLNLGGYEVLSKPLQKGEVLRAVGSHMARVAV